MPAGPPLTFGDFRIDPVAKRLWRGTTRVELRAKSFAVLRHLLARRGWLVTKEELLRAAWPDTAVSRTVLRVCIREIRAALGDDAGAPRFVATVGRSGYRLTAAGSDAAAHTLVGRDRELDHLRALLARVREGRRHVAFVTGEPGIGKTALVEHFADEVRGGGLGRVGAGQCIEVHGGGGADMALLDLLERLGSEDADGQVRAALERWAPTWLLQLPGLIADGRADGVRRRAAPTGRERVLRELATALEALARDEPLVLVLEDLHWADSSTAEALAYLAQRTPAAQLLVVATYRPAAVVLANHPVKRIKQELHGRGAASELALELLAANEVGTWLRGRTGGEIAAGVAARLQRATDGNPLFMVAMTDYLLERGLLAQRDRAWRLQGSLDGVVPESLRELVGRQVDDLTEVERATLDALSAAGGEAATAALAAATGAGADTVERTCAGVASRGQLVRAAGLVRWPDGTVSGAYAFAHALYRDVFYQRLAPAERRRLHRALGERIERGHAGATGLVAAVLASHFQLGGDEERAVAYHAAAAAAARARFAEREAIVHLEAALAELPALAPGAARDQRELALRLELGAASLAARGYAAAEVEPAYERACELARSLGAPQSEMVAIGGLHAFYVMGAQLHRARPTAEAMVAMAERFPAPLLALIAHTCLGGTLFNLAELSAARRHLERAHAAWSPELPRIPLDPGFLHRSMLGLTLLLLGQRRQAVTWLGRAHDYAAATDDPFTLSWAQNIAAQFWATAGEKARGRQHAEQTIVLAEEHGFPVHRAAAHVIRAWADGDAAAITTGIAAYEATGQRLATSLLRGLLAETLIAQQRFAEARAVTDEAIAYAAETGEARHLAELHRLRGETMRAPAARERCFAAALAVAREQSARLWELRAGLALARLHVARRRPGDAGALLERTLSGFGSREQGVELAAARALAASLPPQRRVVRRSSAGST